MTNKKKLVPVLLPVLFSLFLTVSCKGRLPSAPVPSQPPASQPPASQQPASPAPVTPPSEKPPAVNPEPPDDGTGALPKPPDPNQPVVAADFFNLMRLNGYTISKEEITSAIQKQAAIKITDWSPGTIKDKTKNIQEHFKKYGKGFESVEKYTERSMAVAAKADKVHFYVSMAYGNQNNTINLLKVNPETAEILYFNKSGLISNFAKDTGGLLKLKFAMFVPVEVLKPATEATRFGNYNRR